MQEVLDHTDWSQRELERRANLSDTAVAWNLWNRTRPVKPSTLEAIAKAAGASLRGLSLGQGKPYDDDGGMPLSAFDTHYETGAPLPDAGLCDEFTAAGQKAVREGEPKSWPPKYRVGAEKGTTGA